MINAYVFKYCIRNIVYDLGFYGGKMQVKYVSLPLLLLALVVYVVGFYFTYTLVTDLLELVEVMEAVSSINFDLRIDKLNIIEEKPGLIRITGESSINITWGKPSEKPGPTIIFNYKDEVLAKIILSKMNREYYKTFNFTLHASPSDINKYINVHVIVNTSAGEIKVTKKLFNISNIIAFAGFSIENMRLYTRDNDLRLDFNIRTNYPVKIPISIVLRDKNGDIVVNSSLTDFNTFENNPYHVSITLFKGSKPIKFICIEVYGAEIIRTEIKR